MSYLLRKIHKARWDPAYRDELGLAPEAVPADCLGDLNTARCALSLWEVFTDRSNLDSLIVAMATTRDHSANFEYALIEYDLVAAVGRLQQTEGNSPNPRANQEWHRDLSVMTVDKLGQLVSTMFASAERVRVMRKDVENLIREAVRRGHIDRGKMNEQLRVRLAL